MSLDGIVIHALVDEFNTKLVNAKIDKVYQPEKDEIHLNIHSKKNKYKLLISASSNNTRIHLTNISKSNPISPPMFCMLLRKHLQGTRIVNISQPEFERIIYFDVKGVNELGELTEKRLIVEIMGKHSNIILVEKNGDKIIDAIKRIYPDISTIRQVLPGMSYSLPPSQNKINPLTTINHNFFSNIPTEYYSLEIYKYIYKSFMGISPLVAREICFDAGIEYNTPIAELDIKSLDKLNISFDKLLNQINNNTYEPTIVKNDDTIIAFSAINLKQYHNDIFITDTSMSKILQTYYTQRDLSERIKQSSYDLRKNITNKIERNRKKLAKQQQQVLEAQKREKYKIYGELITSNIYKLSKGDTNLECINYYSENQEIINIKLDKKLYPAQNAQKYYKKYNKLKNTAIYAAEQIEKTKQELLYLENVLYSINNCTNLLELDEIKEELLNEGYIKEKTKKKAKKKKKNEATKPRHYISSEGYDIYVGKNNNQNDYITLKLAQKEDLWLHTKEIAGSHVIVKANNTEIPEKTIIEAAILAAYYSKGNQSSNVPIDYTLKKNVKKPNGAKPGMVIYKTNSTIYVTPDEKIINNLKEIK
ncbi:Rqc2 family fibronectin-binding protein [Abyssisolibacter fermentans]|uniref:Rqc2 family fibronectin-binding protein n=1 Tax=Abyssisolibacter fermentans TaxID=1766203 RepID=UPI0008371251|nr:NFACT RNA binding domain-containing protein [Abyssisolibacter fermentans]